jgi:membrane protein YqaA with SNARE-associated domain
VLRRLYDRIIGLAAGPNALWALVAISFAESSFFPIPPDILLIPMMLARPRAAWRLAAVCTLASVSGGVLGYAIGYYGFDLIGRPILELNGAMGGYDTLKVTFDRWGVWIIMIKGLLPIPYKLVTITSGAFHFDRLAQHPVLSARRAAVVVRPGGARLHRTAADAGDQRICGLPRWRVCDHSLSISPWF